VGDSAIDHETARRAATRCCLVSYGFGFQSVSVERLTPNDCVVDNAAELAAVIEQFAAQTGTNHGEG